MESNTTLYKDLTPAKQLDKKVLNKMVWRSLFLQMSFNFERMQAAGWLYGIHRALEGAMTRRQWPNPESYVTRSRHMTLVEQARGGPETKLPAEQDRSACSRQD